MMNLDAMEIVGLPRFGPGLVTVVAALAVVAWLAVHHFVNKADPQEPPYIQPGLPLIGHVTGMIRHGAKYFEIVNKHSRYPIFTLPMLATRNYIVSDAALAGHVQRNKQTLSFYSLIVEVTRRLIAFDEDAAKISMHNMNGEHGPGGLMEAVHEMMNRLLAPGPNLDSIASTQMEQMSKMLNESLPNGKAITTSLYAWQRHIFSLCNAFAIYGPNNIFARHPELEDAFWTFEDGMLGLVIDIYPSITARKAHLARKRVLRGLIEYVKREDYKMASALIQERVQTNLSFGMSKEMAGHAELILMFGILGNAVPSNFWLIANIFSRPKLLERIRVEVLEAIGIEQPQPSESETVVSFHTKKINIASCPLLYSCYRETLREISLLTSARMVMEDTLLPRGPSGQAYLLKKNSIVQIAGGVIHHDQSIWGGDAGVFNSERFLAPDSEQISTAVPLPRNVPSSAFRAYGGGTVICPGRHFAQAELMSLAAVLALGFDIFGSDGGALVLPPKDDQRIPLSVMKPTYDPLVRIQRRPGWEMVRWSIVL